MADSRFLRPTPNVEGDPSSYGGSGIMDFIRSALERASRGGAYAYGAPLVPPSAPTAVQNFGDTKMGPDLTPPASQPSTSQYPSAASPSVDFMNPDFTSRLNDFLQGGQRSAPAPEAKLKFAWGGGKPEAYVPGQTDISRAEGAPPSDTFMGRTTRPGGGTFSVLNPPAYKDEDTLAEEYFRNRMERNIKDPFWEEREKAKIWSEAQIGAQSGLYDLRAKQIQRWGEDQKAGIDNDPNTSPEAKQKARAEIDNNVNQMLNELYGGQGSSGVRSPGNFPKI